MDHEEVVRQVSALEVEVANLKVQDRDIKDTVIRIDYKLDSLKMWLIGAMAGVIASIFVSLVK